MTHDDHQRERMRAWVAAFTATISTECGAHVTADGMLDSFDKRFPAPSAAVTYDPVTGIFDGTPSAAAPVEPVTIRDTRLRVDIPAAELASLRQKARLWDAVASGKVRIDYNLDDTYGAFYGPIGRSKRTLTLDTAEEAVESAIAQGALK